MFGVDWLIGMGASAVDVIIFVMGMLFAIYMINRDRTHREENKALWSENRALRGDIKELTHKYSQVDKLAYGIGIAIQRTTGIKLFKQSADKSGDNSLNRDVE